MVGKTIYIYIQLTITKNTNVSKNNKSERDEREREREKESFQMLTALRKDAYHPSNTYNCYITIFI